MQHFESYDPLTVVDQDDGLLVAARKREIRNILKSYTGYYDPFAEILQNAFDAVEKRAHEEDVDYLPQIWITVDINKKQISVTDNGCGMEFSEFQMFLKPNYSFKSGSRYRGMKGVGATYLAYGFNDLQVSTKLDGKTWSGKIVHGRNWVEDESGELAIPMFTMSTDTPHQPFEKVDTGTSVTIRLVGEGIRPKDLAWAGATDALQWLALLRVHTPLGAIYIEPDQPYFAIRISLEVVDSNGKITSATLDNPEYLYPHKEAEFSPVVNLREYQGWTKKEIEKRITPRKSKRFSNLAGFWITGDADDILNDHSLFPDNLSPEHRELVKELNVRVYYFMCYTNDLWVQLKNRLNLRKNTHLLRGGLQIATRHMPQGPLLTIPISRMLGFQTTTHIVLHIDAEPDLGRKGFQPEHVNLAETLAQRLVEQYGTYRWELLRRNIGTASRVKELKLQTWIEEQRQHEELHPLKKIDPRVLKPLNYLPTVSEPQVEQDVVALFNQMLSSGIIRGILMLSSSQYEQYDGLYRDVLEVPYSAYAYDPATNPLGVVRSSMPSDEKPFTGSIKVLEFKYSLDALFEELSMQDKDANALDLVVAWEIGEKWSEMYSITSYLTPTNISHREYHGFTHRFENPAAGTVVFNAIILKDLINYLHDPVAEEKRQALLEDQYYG